MRSKSRLCPIPIIAKVSQISSGWTHDCGFSRLVDPHPKPQFQHQQPPQSCVMACPCAYMLVQQLLDVVLAEYAATGRGFAQEHIVSHLLELGAKPVIDRA